MYSIKPNQIPYSQSVLDSVGTLCRDAGHRFRFSLNILGDEWWYVDKYDNPPPMHSMIESANDFLENQRYVKKRSGRPNIPGMLKYNDILLIPFEGRIYILIRYNPYYDY